MLVVYLDSSDFSNIAKAHDDPHWDRADEWRAVEVELIRAREKKIAEFRFPHIHVAEIIHTDPSYKNLAVSRAKAVQRICGRKYLRYSPTVFLEEAIALCENGPLLDRAHVFSEDSWFPEVSGIRGRYISQLSDMIKKELLHTGLSRSQRRKAESRVFRPNGTLRRIPELAALEVIIRDATREFSREWLLPDEICRENMFFRCLVGEIPESRLDSQILNAFTNVVGLTDRYYDLITDPNDPIARWIRGMGREISTSIDNFRDLILRTTANHGLDFAQAMYQTVAHDDAWTSMFSGLRRRLLGEIRKSESDNPRIKRIPDQSWEERVLNSRVGDIPSLDILLAVAEKHMRTSTLPSPVMRKPKISDGGDLLHMCYMPFVDIFRCDGYSSQIAKTAVIGSSPLIASSIADAVEACRQ
jgi:hypothetical protein